MSNMLTRRQAILAGLGSIATLGLAACGGSASSDGAAADGASKVYKIATDTTFAPFEYAETDGTYVGIDVELLAAVAADQGFEYELEPLGFDAALQAV